MFKNKQIIFLSCLLIFSACSGSGKSKSKSFSRRTLGEPIPLYDYEEIETDQALISSQANSFVLQRSIDDSPIEVSFPFLNFQNTSFSSEVVFGGEAWQHISSNQIVRDSKAFSPIGDGDYPENTYQNATIHVMNSLRLAKAALIEDTGIELAKIRIRVGFLQREYWDKSDGTVYYLYDVNNAYYDPKDHQITFTPQGKRHTNLNGGVSNVPNNGLPLWQMPFVAAHEYGHHLFERIFEHSFFSSNHSYHNEDKGLCFRTDDFFNAGLTASESAYNGTHLNSSILHLFYSLHEGFADLFATYALGERIGEIHSDMGCMKIDRTVKMSSFCNGVTKKLDDEELFNFISQKEIPVYATSGSYIRYDDSHMFGAALAHMINAIFEKRKVSGRTNLLKLKLLVSWLQAVNRNKDSLFDGHLSQKRIVEKIIRLASNEELSYTEIREIVPFYSLYHEPVYSTQY